MKNMKRILILFSLLLFLGVSTTSCKKVKRKFAKMSYTWGDKVDSLNGVYVYYNDNVSTVKGRNVVDGYNIGLKYQCVEFVKRYYFEHYNHRMPDSYGHAKDFFQSGIADGNYSKRRDLYQYTNPSKSKPQVGDLLVYGPVALNKFGHVSIVSKVDKNKIEIIQQNPGAYGDSRQKFSLTQTDGKWRIEHSQIVGWLRKK